MLAPRRCSTRLHKPRPQPTRGCSCRRPRTDSSPRRGAMPAGQRSPKSGHDADEIPPARLPHRIPVLLPVAQARECGSPPRRCDAWWSRPRSLPRRYYTNPVSQAGARSPRVGPHGTRPRNATALPPRRAAAALPLSCRRAPSRPAAATARSRPGLASNTEPSRPVALREPSSKIPSTTLPPLGNRLRAHASRAGSRLRLVMQGRDERMGHARARSTSSGRW